MPFAHRAPRAPVSPDVIAVPLRPRPEAWVAGQQGGHMDIGPLPTGLAPESLVLYTQALGIPTGYLQISPQREFGIGTNNPS